MPRREVIYDQTPYLAVGDKVKVTRKAVDYEQGWDDIWHAPTMDRSVGRTYSIKQVVTNNTLEYLLCNNCYYPPFVLEKQET